MSTPMPRPCKSVSYTHLDVYKRQGVHSVKALAPRGAQNANQIDDRIGAGHSGLDRGRVAQIGLDGHDLADIAKRLKLSLIHI